MLGDGGRTFSGREVLYIVGLVFLTCIIVSLGSFMLIGHNTAVVGADVAGIGIAIVLAVIAIVWTMVDSGGQKQNVIQLQTAVGDLQRHLKGISELMDKAQQQWLVAETLVSGLQDMIRDNEAWRQEIKQIIATSRGAEKINAEEQMSEMIKRIEQVLVGGEVAATVLVDPRIRKLRQIVENKAFQYLRDHSGVDDSLVADVLRKWADLEELEVTDPEIQNAIDRARSKFRASI